MSKFAQALRQHFQSRTAGKAPPPRIKHPVVSGPHRLGDSGYSFTVKQSRSIPGSVAVVWTPAVPSAAVLKAHSGHYEAVIATVMPEITANLPTGGVESWA